MTAELETRRAELLDVIEQVRVAAPSFPLDLVVELIHVAEFQLALEILCENLHELDVRLPTEARRELVRLCVACRVTELYWAAVR